MANTYSQVYIHLVFAVKNRANFIKESFRNELEKYICGIVKGKQQKPLAIYAMPDHTHLLVGLLPAVSVSELMRDVKANSSRFINEKHWLKEKFQWQQGYGAFSYSRSQLNVIIKYIINQPVHHRKKSFKDEYIDMLKKFEVEHDQKYLFDWLE